MESRSLQRPVISLWERPAAPWCPEPWCLLPTSPSSSVVYQKLLSCWQRPPAKAPMDTPAVEGEGRLTVLQLQELTGWLEEVGLGPGFGCSQDGCSYNQVGAGSGQPEMADSYPAQPQPEPSLREGQFDSLRFRQWSCSCWGSERSWTWTVHLGGSVD